MSNYNFSSIFNNAQLGKNFEDEITEPLIKAGNKVWGDNLGSRKGTKHEDLMEGTDFVMGGGLRLDITLNDNKNNVIWSDDTNITIDSPALSNDIAINFGVRTGNARGEFKEPVLVIKFNININSSNNLEHIVHNVLANELGNILETGEDVYWEICDELEAIREKQASHNNPTPPNPPNGPFGIDVAKDVEPKEDKQQQKVLTVFTKEIKEVMVDTEFEK